MVGLKFCLNRLETKLCVVHLNEQTTEEEHNTHFAFRNYFGWKMASLSLTELFQQVGAAAEQQLLDVKTSVEQQLADSGNNLKEIVERNYEEFKKQAEEAARDREQQRENFGQKIVRSLLVVTLTSSRFCFFIATLG